MYFKLLVCILYLYTFIFRWVEAWLNFALICPSVADLYKKASIVRPSENEFAPRPGPCCNKRLIEWDKDKKKWVCKKYLAMANELRGGDYRRVTQETWEAFAKMYPKSGPAITMVFYYDAKLHSDGYYPTEEFVILDPPVNPPVEENFSILSWFSTRRLDAEAMTTSPMHEEKAGEETIDRPGDVVGIPEILDPSQSLASTPSRPVQGGLRERLSMRLNVTPDRLSARMNSAEISHQSTDAISPTPIPIKTSTPGPTSGVPPLSHISYALSDADGKEDEDMNLTERSWVSSAQNPRPRSVAEKLAASDEARKSLLSTKQQSQQHSISLTSIATNKASTR